MLNDDVVQEKSAMWVCPKCGRSFRKTGQLTECKTNKGTIQRP